MSTHGGATPIGPGAAGGPVRANWLVELSLTRKVTVVMVFLAICLMGVIAYLRTPVQMFPAGFEAPFLYVRVMYPNANPREVEQDVLLPWEELLGTVKGVKTIWAQAGSDFAGTFLEFHQNTDMRTAYNQVRDRLERLKARVPAGAGEFMIWRFDPASQPIFLFSVRFEQPVDDARYLAENYIGRAIERLEGVSKVEVNGAGKRIVAIELIPERMQAHSINAAALYARLQRENFQTSAGKLTEGAGTTTTLVRSIGRVGTIDTYEDLPVAPGVRLADIATVHMMEERGHTIDRIDGEEALSVAVFRTSDANTVALSKRLHALLADEFSKDPRLPGLATKVITDEGKEVESGINNLQMSAIYGGLIAIVTIFIFLPQFVPTLIISAIIPVSLLMTLIVLYVQGESVNVMTLMGFMLAVGMVVDNGIVVTEAIYQKLKAGMPPVAAARAGASEVGIAILTSTATTIVVFLPLMLMSGQAQFTFFLQKLGFPVCYALAASLLVALVFIPPASVKLVTGGEWHEPRWITRMTEVYGRTLAWVLAHPTELVIGLAVLAALSVPMIRGVPDGDSTALGKAVRVHVNFPGNMSFDERDTFSREIEKVLVREREALRLHALRAKMEEGQNQLQMQLFLRDPVRGDPSTAEVIEKARSLLPRRAGVTSQIGWRESTKRMDASVVVSIYGEDTGTLIDLAGQVEKRLQRLPELSRVEAAPEALSGEEIRLVMEREMAGRLGISPVNLASTLAGTVMGQRLRDFDSGHQRVEVWVRGEKSWREGFDNLLSTPLSTATPDLRGIASSFGAGNLLGAAGQGLRTQAAAAGTAQPTTDTTNNTTIMSLTQVERGKSFSAILRKDRRTTLTVNINTTEQDLEGLKKKLGAELDRIVWPAGYTYDLGDRFRDMQLDRSAQKEAAVLAVLFVFLLMGILFESFALPLAVIVTIPLAAVGAWGALFVTQTPFDVTCGVGIVVLIGIVVNNGIVLIDHINQLRAQGVDRTTAIVRSGRERLRPILMTALSTIAGLVPMALGDSAVFGVPYAPMGKVVIGGLTASTLLTLIVVPSFYAWIDDARGKLLSLVRGPAASPTTEPVSPPGT